jgi:hypothetical protein
VNTTVARTLTADAGAKAAAGVLRVLATLGLVLGALHGPDALAHAIGGKDAAFVAAMRGPAPGAFLYLGAKHMVTGYDHLLFLLGVIFFLRRLREVVLYVSLFSLGHSVTLLSGVLLGFGLNAWLVDAAIGLSVAWKAFDNIGGFDQSIGWRPDPRWTVLGFGLIHGLGLATKLEELRLAREGLLVNLVSFNLGVEIGQALALAILLAIITAWRRTRLFGTTAVLANAAIMAAGFTLTGYQLAGYFWSTAP